MRVAPEPAEERQHLLVHQIDLIERCLVLGKLLGTRQFTEHQQVGHFREMAVLRQLLDGITAVEQDALVAVDESNRALGRSGGSKTGIEGENSESAIERLNVHRRGPKCSVQNGQTVFAGSVRESRGHKLMRHDLIHLTLDYETRYRRDAAGAPAAWAPGRPKSRERKPNPCGRSEQPD